MTEQTKRTVSFWYSVFLSVFTIALGIAFLASVSDIYFSAKEGEQIFTRENVTAQLLPCFITLIVWIVAVIAGFVLSVLLPSKERKKRSAAPETIYRKLLTRIPKGEGEELRCGLERVKKTERIRVIVWCVAGAVCVAAGVIVLAYAFNPKHFTAEVDFNTDVLNMAKWVLPCTAISFLCCIAAAIVERETAKRTLPVVKKLIAAGATPKVMAEYDAATAKRDKYVLLGVRIAVAALAVALIIWGIFNGGANDVFIKAINICTECIGLG